VSSLTAPLDWTGGPSLIWVVCAALLYWLGGRGQAPRRGGRWRVAAFVAGLAAIVVALDSPIDDYADELFWVHMVQHILLIGVAAPLLALARPWSRMWHGFPLHFRRAVARPLTTSPSWGRQRRLAAWHVPALYDAALRWELLHALEHLAFFATALLFWTRVVPSAPWRSSLSEAGKIVYLGSTLLVGWMLAIVLALASAPLYSAYAEAGSRPGGISALTDQQLAAGVMWVPGGLAYMIAIAVIAYRLLEPRDSRRTASAGNGYLPRGVV
jgi:putative membrane protein